MAKRKTKFSAAHRKLSPKGKPALHTKRRSQRGARAQKRSLARPLFVSSRPRGFLNVLRGIFPFFGSPVVPVLRHRHSVTGKARRPKKRPHHGHRRHVKLQGVDELFTDGHRMPTRRVQHGRLVTSLSPKKAVQNREVSSRFADGDLPELLAEEDAPFVEERENVFEETSDGQAPQSESSVTGDSPEDVSVVTLEPEAREKKSTKSHRRFFLLHLPFSFGEKSGHGRLLKAGEKNVRKEAPLDISEEEMKALRGERQESEKSLKEKRSGKKQEREHRKERERAERLQEAQKKEVEEASKEPVETVVKKNVKRQKGGGPSGFRDFLGALSTVGLGRERSLFIQNLATMLNAGLSIVESLKILQVEMHSRGMRKIAQRIVEAVEGGSALWRAMEQQHCFSPHAISLVRVGEEAGNLAENMQYLSEQQEKDHALKQKVKMAMIYPAIVLTLMLVIVLGLGLFVLPNLIQVLLALNVPLPLVTRLLIAFTNAFTAHAPVAVPGLLGGIVILIILAKFTPLRGVTQWVVFHIPGVGRLAKEATIARFGVILGGLLKAGVPLVEALQSLVDVTPTVAYHKLYRKLLDHVLLGDSFSKSFAAVKRSRRLLPLSVQQLIVTGERSGSLATVCLKIADIYERKANETAQKLPIILEPIILLIIGGLVATIALAIIVPIYSIVGNVGRQ